MADTPEDLQRWVDTLAEKFGIDPSEVPTGMLLNVTRDAAHGVVRPAGPITTYLMGLAVAAGRTPDEAAEVAREAVSEWQR
ncbi:DUF6457 domain-containing protein [Gulosibacter faecalis]|jgi:hypothetical protein|uniref:DUF6457 domain-containing protein n=1 Tax=Gulosibacter faecalis TaxID=272240 RepID=A0ABW5UXM9_9MICO|nr:DUF6457 domain-containing protein [Gulosibacter faecalis]